MQADNTSNDSRDDAALVKAVQRGDAGAFEPLLDRHLGHIHAFIALKLPVAQVVDELAHETFVFAYHNIREFKAGTAFRAWLRAIASNKVRAEVERFCREQRNQLSYAEQRLIEIARNEPDTRVSREVEHLEECLEEVPPHMRQLLRLKYHDECSAEEMSQRFQRSLAWVRTTLCRVRQQLKACIERRLATEVP